MHQTQIHQRPQPSSWYHYHNHYYRSLLFTAILYGFLWLTILITPIVGIGRISGSRNNLYRYQNQNSGCINGLCNTRRFAPPAQTFRTQRNFQYGKTSTPVHQVAKLTTTTTTGHSECQVGECVYYYNCNTQHQQRSTTPNKFCSLDNGFTGVCCTDVSQTVGTTSVTVSQGHWPTQTQPSQPPPSTFNRPINVEMNEVQRILNNLARLEDELTQNQIIPKRNTKEFSHQNFFGHNQQSLNEMQNAFQVLQGFINFSKREKLSISDIINSRFDVRKTGFANTCGPNPTCNIHSRYRTPDGRCNNLLNTAQGKAVSTFSRLLPPQYADGINEPRRAIDGGELPNPRVISLSIAPESAVENNRYTIMLMQFGQFADHDLTRTATTRTHNDQQISCCNETVLANPRLLHPACFVIPVPNQDLFLRSASQECINFVRSAPALNPKCRFGPREQLNQLSSYIDGNNVYGTTQNEVNSLRQFSGGLLRVSMINRQQFPPMNMNDSSGNCQIPKHSQLKCFIGGDNRANEVIDLVVLHTVWLREHNRIATELSQLNPSWNDETLYQEAKRILVAEMQHIIYSEFLPLILGNRAMIHFRLQLSNGFSNAYNPSVDATILNEFSTAAYRLHSLIQGLINFNTPDNRVVSQVQLRNVFNNPEIMYEKDAYEMRMAGMVGQPIQRFDNYFTREVTNHLFQIPGKHFGLDLVSLNIQRGRDHGLPGYVKYREICGLARVNTFNDLKRHFSNPKVADVMQQLYRNVEDIDLFIAGSSERPLPGAIVGPTFACIIGEQFRRIKEGDRFWYENAGQTGSFTEAQLAQIKQVTLSRVLCDNSNIEIMQPIAFLMPSNSNPKVPCLGNDIPRVDLRAWAL